jgi:D-alanyl-D-alanine carboxypeptidase
VLLACAGDDDDTVTTTTTTTTTLVSTTTTSTAPPFTDAWSEVPSPDTSCFVAVDADGDFVIDHNADVPVIPASTIKLLPASLAPDDQRVVPMLRHSDNDAARSLVDDLGGVDAVRDALLAQSRPMNGVVIADATGHDRADRVTCRLLVSVLTTVPLRDALAEPGQPGTMQARYLDHAGRLHAKTGSIRGVASLAGYADDLTFAAILNADADPTPALDALVDGLLP